MIINIINAHKLPTGMEDHGESGPGSWTGLLSSAKCVQINQSQKTITQNSSGVKQLMDKPSSGAVLRMIVVAHMTNIEIGIQVERFNSGVE